MMIKAITVWQPWATLIAEGVKEYETRSWEPSSAGVQIGDVFGIHAAKRATVHEEMYNVMIRVHFSPRPIEELPFGAMVAIVRLIHVVPTKDKRLLASAGVDPRELSVGDWSDDRFAWRLEVLRRLHRPIPIEGKQRFWDWMDAREVKTLMSVHDPTEDPGRFFAE